MITLYVYATLMLCSLLGAVVAGAEDEALIAILCFVSALGWFAALVEMDDAHSKENDDDS